MVVRRDVDVEAIGTMADLPPDHTPLQVGARGSLHGRAFKLLGRLRITWGDGSWNEWYAHFGGEAYGWVAEAQGFFAISEAAAVPAGLAAMAKKFKEGQHLNLNGSEFRVVDVKKATVIAGEGELPFVARPGDWWHSAELLGEDGVFAGVDWTEGGAQFFIGSYAQPADIQWTGLRPVPGWAGEPVPVEKNRTDSLPCPACGGVIVLRAAGQTMTLRCGHCGTLVDTSQPQAKVAQKIAKADAQPKSLLPLGRRGTWRGVEWEVIGHLRRKDPYSVWSEYLLYNPWGGFTWLTEWEGHWNWVDRVLNPPADAGPGVDWDGRHYRLFAREKTRVTAVQGEFYWRIRLGEECEMADYVAPPRILSREAYPGLVEVTWSAGEYVPAKTVAEVFKVPGLPAGTGPFLNAPNPYGQQWPTLRKWAIAAVAVLVGVQLLFSAMMGSRRRALDEQFAFNRFAAATAPAPAPADPAAPAGPAPLVSRSFDFDGSQAPVWLTAKAPVNNNWLGFDAELVNETTGERFGTEVTVEQYSGYDDGYWHEGSDTSREPIPAVPPGRYHVELSPEADPSIAQMPFDLSIERGGVFWSNLVLALIAVGLWPLWAGFRYFTYEGKRWQQSDFTPSGQASDD